MQRVTSAEIKIAQVQEEADARVTSAEEKLMQAEATGITLLIVVFGACRRRCVILEPKLNGLCVVELHG